MAKKKAKVFVFAMDHALPTAMVMHEDGNIIEQHAGDSYEDAINWLHYHHPELEEKYEIVTLEKDKVKAHLYEKAPIETLGEDFHKAWLNNQELAKKAAAKEKADI